MAIDSVRLLADSAAQLWRRLGSVRPLASISGSDGFDAWISAAGQPKLDHAEEQALRRDYRRLANLIEELETLVRSRARALELIRTRIAEEEHAAAIGAYRATPNR